MCMQVAISIGHHAMAWHYRQPFSLRVGRDGHLMTMVTVKRHILRAEKEGEFVKWLVAKCLLSCIFNTHLLCTYIVFFAIWWLKEMSKNHRQSINYLHTEVKEQPELRRRKTAAWVNSWRFLGLQSSLTWNIWKLGDSIDRLRPQSCKGNHLHSSSCLGKCQWSRQSWAHTCGYFFQAWACIEKLKHSSWKTGKWAQTALLCLCGVPFSFSEWIADSFLSLRLELLELSMCQSG